ncbi:MAG: CAP domain-containing protein [Pseudomonadota bacterium]
MKTTSTTAVITLFLAIAVFSPVAVATTLSADEQQFADLINDYRAANALSAIDVTVTLTDVAQAHVLDLSTYTPYGGNCNAHSWSNNGSWTGGCYTPDHANASLMWSKPSEFSGGAYSGNGYELIAIGFPSAADALNGFKNSFNHNNVLLNLDIWSNLQWSAMGVGIHQNYYSIWLGTQVDPQGLVGASSVPGPVSLWLFGAGLLGLAVRRNG